MLSLTASLSVIILIEAVNIIFCHQCTIEQDRRLSLVNRNVFVNENDMSIAHLNLNTALAKKNLLFSCRVCVLLSDADTLSIIFGTALGPYPFLRGADGIA